MQDVDHRRPYEVLMLLCPSNSDLTLSDFEVQLNTQPEAHVTARIEQQHDFSPSEDPSAKQGAQLSVAVPDGLVMVSVPGEHSRKPKLAQLLQRYLPGRANCLEVSLVFS